MPSSHTANTGIEKPATGEQSGTWGDTVNTNSDIIDRALNGVGAITLSGTTHTLTTTDGTLTDGMFKCLVLGGSPSGANTITVAPNTADKVYFVINNSGENAIFSQGSGANVTIATGDTSIIACDGAGSGAAVTDITANLASSSVKITGGVITGITDLVVADGGTGVSTLTDGGVLFGSGTAAITATAVLTDGQMIVGDNSGDPALESGATLRTSIGVGTTDSPHFTGVELGHATDTTITKEASGIIAVEGNTIASLDLKQVWTKAQAPSFYGSGGSTALSATSGVLDYDSFQSFMVVLASGSNTVAAPITEADCLGQTGVIIFIQPSSSSAGTLSLHADYETAAAAGITLSTANNDYDIVPYIVKADNSILLGAPQLNFG
jgi:hypothetical protein